MTPGVANEMQKLRVGPRFHFIMGAGAKETGREEWQIFQRRAVKYVEDIFNKTS